MSAIYLIVDNTGSMGEACNAARQAAAEVVALGTLVAGKECVTIGTIGDYDTMTPDHHQGGFSLLKPGAAGRDAWFSKYMKPCGGGGTQEAYRTALNMLLSEEPGILFLFLDAAPHAKPYDDEGKLEEAFLIKNKVITDWQLLTAAVKSAGFRVVTFVTGFRRHEVGKHYDTLGKVVEIPQETSESITRAMMAELCDMVETKADPKTANRDLVIDTFDKMLDVARPEQAMCLTVNPILGKYWRCICGTYKKTHEDKCKQVIDKLSQIGNLINPTQKQILKTWIDASHDETDRIQEMISRSQSNVAYVLKNNHNIGLDEVLELGRGGEFRELAKLIAEIEPVERDDYKLDDYICSDSPLELMQLICHLIAPGVLFSPTVAMFAAVLALPNLHLSTQARTLLGSKVGTWINWEIVDDKQTCPVFWSLNVMRLLKLLPDEFLTSAEIKFRDHFLLVANLSRNQDALVGFKVPVIIPELRRDVTRKRYCPGCDIFRCFTVFPGDSEVCGFCIETNPSHKNYAKVVAVHAQYKTPMDPKRQPEVNDTETHWAQCHTCHANYGVRTSSIPVRPKCYDCRNGNKPETVRCDMCLHMYLSPGGSAMLAMHEEDPVLAATGVFVCPRCVVHPRDMVSEVQCKIGDLLAENPFLKNLVPIVDYNTMMDGSIKLWKRVLKLAHMKDTHMVVHLGQPGMQTIKEHEEKLLSRTQDEYWLEINSSNDPILYKGFTIHANPISFRTGLLEKMVAHNDACCMMCLNNVALRDVVEACGHCQVRICKACVHAWYSQAKVGEIVFKTHISCPFCKSVPKFQVIKQLPLRHFAKKNCAWRENMEYACCQTCLHLKECGQRDCSRETHAVTNFKCSDCKPTFILDMAADVHTKACPSCTVTTEHIGGCRHISCRCGAHWCWNCGKDEEAGTKFDAHNIYDHMAEVCGGIFGGNVEMEDYL